MASHLQFLENETASSKEALHCNQLELSPTSSQLTASAQESPSLQTWSGNNQYQDQFFLSISIVAAKIKIGGLITCLDPSWHRPPPPRRPCHPPSTSSPTPTRQPWWCNPGSPLSLPITSPRGRDPMTVLVLEQLETYTGGANIQPTQLFCWGHNSLWTRWCDQSFDFHTQAAVGGNVWSNSNVRLLQPQSVETGQMLWFKSPPPSAVVAVFPSSRRELQRRPLCTCFSSCCSWFPGMKAQQSCFVINSLIKETAVHSPPEKPLKI